MQSRLQDEHFILHSATFDFKSMCALSNVRFNSVIAACVAVNRDKFDSIHARTRLTLKSASLCKCCSNASAHSLSGSSCRWSLYCQEEHRCARMDSRSADGLPERSSRKRESLSSLSIKTSVSRFYSHIYEHAQRRFKGSPSKAQFLGLSQYSHTSMHLASLPTSVVHGEQQDSLELKIWLWVFRRINCLRESAPQSFALTNMRKTGMRKN